MSYILDALKKSQQQRQALETPVAPSLPDVAPVAARRYTRWWLLTALLLAVGGWVWWPVTESQPEAPLSPEPVPAGLTTTDNPQITLPIRPQPATLTAPADPVVEEPVRPAVVMPPPAVETRSLPPLAALRKVPPLMITSHIYSPLAEKRSVTMNNRLWREGEPVAEGVTLQQITPQGIVLDVDGWPLSVNRQQGWQPIPDGY